MASMIQIKGGGKTVIILSSEKKRISDLDKRRLAKAIAVIIPMLIESNRIVSSMSADIRIESRLILK